MLRASASYLRNFREVDFSQYLAKLNKAIANTTSEIRDEIWRVLLKRLTTIHPGEVVHEWEGGSSCDIRYKWNEGLDMEIFGCRAGNAVLGHSFTSAKKEPVVPLMIQYSTDPDEKQADQIAKGAEFIPFELNPIGANQERAIAWDGKPIFREGYGPAQILNRILVFEPTPLYGLAILRTCKRISAECLPILYGENTFAFSTAFVHNHFGRNDGKNMVPGHLTEHDGNQTAMEISRSIDNMFDHDGIPCTFVDFDPMLTFLRTIGRLNTSFLTRIKLDGCMRSVDPYFLNHRNDPGVELPVGFGYSLRVYSTVLRRACPKLEKLTIQMENELLESGHYAWDEDFLDLSKFRDRHNLSKLKDQDRIDSIVGRVVVNLPQLKELWLEGTLWTDTTVGGPAVVIFKDSWGMAARWMRFVRDRKHHGNVPVPDWEDDTEEGRKPAGIWDLPRGAKRIGGMRATSLDVDGSRCSLIALSLQRQYRHGKHC
jgi:hypothetical protein